MALLQQTLPIRLRQSQRTTHDIPDLSPIESQLADVFFDPGEDVIFFVCADEVAGLQLGEELAEDGDGLRLVELEVADGDVDAGLHCDVELGDLVGG